MTITRAVRGARRGLLAGAVAAGLLLTGAAGVPTAVAAEPVQGDGVFRPGQPWPDESGEPINAHGGQVVVSQDADGDTTYYWYGEDRSNGYYDSPGVHVYSSRDLTDWTDEGLALRALDSPDQLDTDPYFESLYGDYDDDQRVAVVRDLLTRRQPGSGANPAIIERPKVLHNDETGQWVMWFHADGPSATSGAQYAKAQAGVAVSDSPTGPFRFIDSYRLDVAPEGEPNYQPDNPGMARDMNLFKDDDGTAYIVYSSEENYSLFISRLDDSYTYLSTPVDEAAEGEDFTRPYVGAHREAPAIFKTAGTYYLMTSGATGWDPNTASYATATDILGEWTDHGNPAEGDGASTTFDTQSTSFIPVDPANGRFIYMGDRWTPDDLSSSPYVWLPVTLGEGGSLSIEWHEAWTLDDLQPQAIWTAGSRLMPDEVWLGGRDRLPPRVTITEGGERSRANVTWDTSDLVNPGVRTVTGTLQDGSGRSFERQVLVVPQGLSYLVNAGGARTEDWQRMVAVTGSDQLLNSSPEQELGPDPVTGRTWGYVPGASQPHSGDDIYHDLRYATGGSDLVYTFDGLEPDQEQVVRVGYHDPWPWANRAARVLVNGAVVEEQRLFFDASDSATYRAVADDAGRITVTLEHTRSPDIQVSWIAVSDR